MQRLRQLASFIPPGSRVADIGTDHALLPRILLGKGHASLCIATEVDRAALDRLRGRFGDRSLPDNLEFRAGDGLAPLKRADRLDVLVLAGMGAGTIVRILSSPRRAELGPCLLVLQPQGDPAVLRRWLAANGYRIRRERVQRIRSGFHLTLAAGPASGDPAPSHPDLNPEDLVAAGPLLVQSGDPLVRMYWERQFHRLLRLEQAGLSGPGGRQVSRDREQAERILRALPPDKL